MATVQLEKCMANTKVFHIIVGKFSHRQEPVSIMVFEIDKCSEIGLYGTVLPLCLANCLGVESG